MGSGKPVGDGIYWPLNKIEEERLQSSQRGARNQANGAAAPAAAAYN